MKTIVITIEESALERLDQLTRKGKGKRRNLSGLIRRAVAELIARLQREAQEEHERKVIRRHHRLLNRQAAALIRERAKL